MATNTLCNFNQLPILQEIHHGTIRAHHAKTGYDYPTIHLPFAFSGLIELPTRIYQTVHDGALAFLVVVSSESSPDKYENAVSSAESSAFTRRGSPVRIRASPSFLFSNRTRK
jgi:hypothetical protein